MKRRLIVGLLFILIIAVLSGCGGGSPPPPPPPSTFTASITCLDHFDAPLSGVLVEISGTSLSGTSGANGIVTIANIPAGGSYHLRFSGDGLAPYIVYATEANLKSPNIEMTLNTWDQMDTQYSLIFDRTKAVVVAKIIDVDKEAVPSATGTISPATGTIIYPDGGSQTDGSGKFVINGIPLNATYTIGAEHSELDFKNVQIIVGDQPAVYQFFIEQIPPTFTSSVKCVDHDGAPLNGVTVDILGTSLTDVSGPDGIVTISNIPEIPEDSCYFVRFTCTGKATLILYESEIDLKTPGVVIPLYTWAECNMATGLTLNSTKAVVVVHIYDASGNDVENARGTISPAAGDIIYNGGGTQTNMSGAFAINNIPLNTTYTIGAEKTGFIFDSVTINVGNQPVLYKFNIFEQID